MKFRVLYPKSPIRALRGRWQSADAPAIHDLATFAKAARPDNPTIQNNINLLNGSYRFIERDP
jgi:hypothetical protein